MTVSTDPSKPNWIGLIGESVHTSDDIDIGDINAMSRDFIVVKRGIVNVHYYYIPISKVEAWDGNVLWLRITEKEAKENSERNNLVPDPMRYYVRDYPYESVAKYTTAKYPDLVIIPPKYKKIPYITTTSSSSSSSPELSHLSKCDLCDTLFKTEDELSNHVKTHH